MSSMEMLEYKGYKGRAEIDYDAKMLHGRVLDLRDVITFEGRTVQELEQAFRESVEEYLALCQEMGRTPEKPYSGQFVLRVPPALHKRAAMAASEAGISLNQWAMEALQERLEGGTDRQIQITISTGSLVVDAGTMFRPAGEQGRSIAMPRRLSRETVLPADIPLN